LDPDQCAICGEYGHWASDCKQCPPQEEEEVQIRTVSDDKVHGVVEASFRDKPIPCALDTTVSRSVIDQALVNVAAIEPFDESKVSRDRPAPTAVGRYCAIFRIEQQLVTTKVDVAPGVGGLTLGLDWLHNNVSTWNLETGKVNIYDGSFQTKVEKSVQMVRTSNQKKEAIQVLMGTPTFPACKKRVAAGPEAP